MINSSWYVRLLLAIGSGVTLALSFPNYNPSLLAWVSVGLLIFASFGARPPAGFLCGFVHGVVFYPLSVPWIDTVMHQYGNVDPWSSAGILGLLSVAFAIFPAFFGLAVAFVSTKLPLPKNWQFACLLAPFLWVAMEFARTYLILGGFPGISPATPQVAVWECCSWSPLQGSMV